MLAVARESFRVIVRGWGGLVLVAPRRSSSSAGLRSSTWAFRCSPPPSASSAFSRRPWRARRRSTGSSSRCSSSSTPASWSGASGKRACSEIADAAPVPDWVSFVGKFAGLGLVLVAVQALLMAAAMLTQVRMGYYDFEFGLYARILFGLQLTDYLLFALLALVVHALVEPEVRRPPRSWSSPTCSWPSARRSGVEHNLLVYGSDPGVDVFGHARLRAVHRAVALVQALLGGVGAAARRRGDAVLGARHGDGVSARGSRWRAAASRVEPPASPPRPLALILTFGGFIFYNTNVLNALHARVRGRRGGPSTSGATGSTRASRSRSSPASTCSVEIYPERREVEIRGTYNLVNTSESPIDSVHRRDRTRRRDDGAFDFDRPAKLVRCRREARPPDLRAGDAAPSRRIVAARVRGALRAARLPEPRDRRRPCRERHVLHERGSGFPRSAIRRSASLRSAGERRAHGLAARPRCRSLDDVEARRDTATGRADRVRGRRRHGRRANRRGARGLRRTWTRGRAPLLPLRHRRADPE